MVNKGLDNLLFNSLKISKKDSVSVIFESERKEVAKSAIHQLTKKGVGCNELLIVNYDGSNLPKKLSAEILSPENNVIVFFFVKSIWHHPERKKAKYELKKRLISYSGTLGMLGGGLASVDPMVMASLTKDLKKFFEGKIGKVLKVTSEGTKLEARIRKTFYEDGLYDMPGFGGNFPAGEMSFGFKEGTANGHIKANVKTKYLGVPKRGKVPEFDIVADRLKNINSDELTKLIRKNKKLSWLGEIGFGIAPDKTISQEKNTISEEKIIGTAHVGLGSNVSFGGTRSGMHMDAVFGPVNIEVGTDVLMLRGKLNKDFLSAKTRRAYKKFIFPRS